MFRKGGLAILLAASMYYPCFGQEWARNMFKLPSTTLVPLLRMPRPSTGSFSRTSTWRISTSPLRTSCGCTTPRVENPSLKTYEKGAIVAHFNTDTFQGPHGATITVTIDKPYYAEVQLQVKGYIRTDVLVEPGSVQFPSIDQGTPPTSK